MLPLFVVTHVWQVFSCLTLLSELVQETWFCAEAQGALRQWHL